MLELGIFSWFGYTLPLAERLSLIAAAGFQATSVWLGSEEDLVAQGEADRIPALVRQVGLTLDNVHAPYAGCNGLWSVSEHERRSAVTEYDSAISFCHRHEIPVCVVHITRGQQPPPQNRTGMQVIQELAHRASERDVVLAVENTGRPDYVDFVFSGIDSPSIGLCYDSSHDFLAGMTRGAILERWRDRLVTTHLSDNNGEYDDHALPWDGSVDWEAIADRFPKKTYSGPILLEVYPQNGDRRTPEEFLHTAYERAVRLRDKLG